MDHIALELVGTGREDSERGGGVGGGGDYSREVIIQGRLLFEEIQ